MAKRKKRFPLPKLSRGWRTVWNLVLALICLYALWAWADYPLPTAELEFRRMERTRLLPQSEIVYNSKRNDPIQWGDLPELSRAHTSLVVGIGDGYVHVGEPAYNFFECWPLEEGITPIPLYHNSFYWFTPGIPHSGTGLMFFQIPKETAQAVVEIHAADYDGQALHYQGEGWRMAPGQWIFAVYPGDTFSGSWYAGGDYTLTLYREDGTLLLEQSGTLPEE